MNGFGNHLKLTVFGQSHAAGIGVVIDGLPAGTPVDEAAVAEMMRLRAPGSSPLATKRREADTVEFFSGVVDGKTVGTSVCALIRNADTHSSDYTSLKNKPRPSHADFPATVKYGENYDLRGGGQFSGRLTAPICIAGAVSLPLLEKRGIRIASHILSVGKVCDRPFSDVEEEKELMQKLAGMPFAVIDEQAGDAMQAEIRQAAAALDSVGGVIECKITGLPVGLGDPMFGGIEGVLSSMLFGIPAVKGIEFGAGFAGSALRGSEYNDPYRYAKDGSVRTVTNHAGGICGGMATGMPVIFRVAVKPTPSIALPQKTVDLAEKCDTEISIHGRHDPCIAVRANVVVRAATAFAILDLLSGETNTI